MAKKDKFAQMQQGGGVSSFQETLVQAATTVAAIERQQEQAQQQAQQQQSRTAASTSTAPADSVSGESGNHGTANTVTPVATREPSGDRQPIEQPKYMRLPNPQIPLEEYNLVSLYCSSLPNMTRQDFVELAIVAQLHTLGRITDEQFAQREQEIRNRPPRGMRKGTKQSSK